MGSVQFLFWAPRNGLFSGCKSWYGATLSCGVLLSTIPLTCSYMSYQSKFTSHPLQGLEHVVSSLSWTQGYFLTFLISFFLTTTVCSFTLRLWAVDTSNTIELQGYKIFFNLNNLFQCNCKNWTHIAHRLCPTLI